MESSIIFEHGFKVVLSQVSMAFMIVVGGIEAFHVISGIKGLGELVIKTRVCHVIHPPVSWRVAA